MNAPGLEGELEFVGAALFGGWAQNASNPKQSVDLDIYIDGKKITTIFADRVHTHAGSQECFRNTGFRFRIPYRFLDGSIRNISVRFAGTDQDLTGSPCKSRPTRDLSESLPPKEMELVNRRVQSSLSQPRPGTFTNLQLDPIRVHVVCYEDIESWILGKIAKKLCEQLDHLGMDVSLSNKPNPKAEINHHIIYWGYRDRKQTPETVMITHIDNRRELGKVRQQLVDLGVEMGICMSLEAVERLAHFGIPRGQLCYVSPAHDGIMTPRKLRIGITTRLYKDGCKREYLIENLAGNVDPEYFRFIIMGAGWQEIVSTLEASGLQVEYYPEFDYEAYQKLIPSLDYFLYTGMDEGSMGFVDALAASVPTIATPQGFHLDVPGGITHPFREFDDLVKILNQLARERAACAARVAHWTWSQYAYGHALIWRYLLDSAQGQRPCQAMVDQLANRGLDQFFAGG